ncbi:MAG: HIT domain-containing protein, partial [Thermomicrobiales bacterium]
CRMEGCPFCLDNGEISPLVTNQLCYLASTDDPVLTNSYMILPRRHVATPFEMTNEEWAATQSMLLEAKSMIDMERPAGYSIGWNVHEVGGQEVPHAHLHVIGRYADEPRAGQGIRFALKQLDNRRSTN